MSKLWNTPRKRWLWLELGFLLLAVLAFSPLLAMGKSIWSEDNVFHWQRIMEIAKSVTHGTFPQFNEYTGFRGNATMTFYPWLTWLPLGLLRLLGIPPVILINVFVVGMLFAGLNIAYFSCYSYARSHWTATAFALLYCVTALITSMYEPQGEDAEMMSYLLAPLALFGWLKLVHGKRSRMFVIGMSLMAYTHLVSTAVVGIVLALMTLFSAKRIHKRGWKLLLKAGLQFTLVTSLVWVPILVLMARNPILTPRLQGPMRSMALAVPSDWKEAFVAMGLTWSLASLVGYFWCGVRIKHYSFFGKWLYVMSALAIFLNIKWLPWGLLQKTPLSVLQFPFRLAIIYHLFLSYLLSVSLSKMFRSRDFAKRSASEVVLTFILLASAVAIGAKDLNNYYQLPNYRIHDENPLGTQDPHAFETKRVHGRLNALILYSSPNLTSRDMNSEGFRDADMNWDYAQKDAVQEYAKARHLHQPMTEQTVTDGFRFKVRKPIRNAVTPLMTYHGQKFSLYVNGRRSNHYRLRKNLVIIPHLPKGSTVITLHEPVMWYRYLAAFTSLTGLGWLILDKKRRHVWHFIR